MRIHSHTKKSRSVITSDSDVYEHEYNNCEKDCSEFENHVEYADRLKLAKNAYEEFLTI